MKLCQFYGETDEIFYAQAFRTELEYWICCELRKLVLAPSLTVCLCTDEWLEGVSKSLATLVESGLYYGLEQ